MLVVATRDNFVVADEENRPGPDFFAHAVFAPHGGPHDLADSWGLQTDEPGGRVADNQQKLHPERSVSEQSKENLEKRSAQKNGRMKRPFPTQFGSAGPQACGCGSSPASGSGRGRGLPAGGTAEVRGVVGSSTDSRFGFLPLSRS